MNKTAKNLLYGSNIWYFGEGMFGPLFAVFTERIGGDILEITWAWATYLIVTGMLHILVGSWIDKRKEIRAQVMVLGYGLNALFTFCYLFVSSPWHLFIVQAGLGIAVAFASPTWEALFARNTDKKHDTLEWGLFGGQAKILTGIAIILGGFVVSATSFTVLFVLMGVIQVGATIYQAQILRKG